MQKSKLFILLTGLTLIGVSALILWSFWEPSKITKGSVVYLLKVSEDARNFPVWDGENEQFDVNMADGEKPSTTILRYDSALPLGELIQKAKALGFVC